MSTRFTSPISFAAAVFSLAVSGCMSAKPVSFSEVRRPAFAGSISVSDEEIAAMLRRPIELPASPRAAVVWLPDADGDDMPLAEADRSRLLDDMIRDLEGAPFASVDLIPTTVDSGRRASNEDDLNPLRSAAARQQSDVLIVVRSRMNGYADWNWLSPAYVALVTLWIVPGTDIGAYAGAESCAIDVRTGLFLGCVAGRGEAREDFVRPVVVDTQLRTVGVDAMTRALEAIPSRLREKLAERVSGEVSAIAPVGSRYPSR